MIDQNERPFVWVDAGDYEDYRQELEESHFQVLEFDSGGSVEGLFREFKERLPLDPPISGRVNWNALQDSLWAGIDGLESESVALVWKDARRFQQNEPEHFTTARSVFTEIAADLGAGAHGARSKKQVRVILMR